MLEYERQSCEDQVALQIDIYSHCHYAFRDEYSNQYLYTTPWDASKVMGCVCDVEYTGYDCSQHVCPLGDDLLTTDQVNERQLIQCVSSGGHFYLYYMYVLHTNLTTLFRHIVTVGVIRRRRLLTMPMQRRSRRHSSQFLFYLKAST